MKLGITGDDISEAFAQMALSGTMGGAMHKNKARVGEMTTYARYFNEKGTSGKYGPKEAHDIEVKTVALHSAFQDRIWSRGYDVVINPTIAKPHIEADYDFTTAKPTINGKSVHPLAGVVLTPIYNLLNWYPVVNVPTSLTSKKVPMGMQIIANSYQDQKAMRVAAAYAAAAPRFFQGELMPDFRKA